ncbi:MAG TPA: S8 family serine peptidase [Bacteroidia bacterium]|nr:S8 family serine peptidase [Bacteroidia bacterium]
MKKIFSIYLLFLSAIQVFAQSDKYVVYFTDKNGSPYSISNPSAYLSPRAIQRRAIQNIPIQTDDLPVNQTYINQVSAIGVTVLNVSKWFNAISIQTSDTNKLNSVKNLPFVVGTQVMNRQQKLKKEEPITKFDFEAKLPSIVSSANRSNSLNYGQALNQIQMLGGDLLHDLGYQGQGTVIAVLDAGFTDVDNMIVFDSLRAGNQILGTRNFVDGGTFVYGFNSHGTSVLSTMGANIPGTFVGTAPKASYYLIRTEDVSSETPIEEFNWLSGVEYADSVGADVINSSLGYTTFDNPALNHTYADQNGHTNISARAASRCASKGIVVVVAAGNEGSSFFHYISSPADADSILAIGAVDGQGNYAGFSSTGPSYDGRIKPNVAAQGSGTTVAYPGGNIGGGSGTSFASPVTAGMVACLRQANPTKNYLQIIDGVQQSASQYSNPDSLKGYGIPNFNLANLLISGIKVNDKTSYGLKNVFPNPFSNQLEFIYNSPENQDLQVQLVDLSGRIVFDATQKVYGRNFNLIQLESSAISKGFYTLRVSGNQGKFEKKVVKN